MSLRRSPRLAGAFLAANRANAQKSTGPRTALGKQSSAANALRTGKRASPAFWPRVLSHSEPLRHAIERAVSADGTNQNVAGKPARLVWSVRRYAERFLRTLPPDARRQIATRLRCDMGSIPTIGLAVGAIPKPDVGAALVTAQVTERTRNGRLQGPPLRQIDRLPPEPKPARVRVITRSHLHRASAVQSTPEGVPLSLKPGTKSGRQTG